MKFSKKILGIIALLVILVFCVVGCGKTETSTGNTNMSDIDNYVMAVVNGKEITRADIGSALIDAEKSVVEQYIYENLQKEFFSDEEVTDKDLDDTLQRYKTNVGEDQWDMYLLMYGGGSEEAFRETLRNEISFEKKINRKIENITISESDLLEKYNEDPDSYNIAVMDVIFLGAENLEKARELYDKGATLKDISVALNIEISEDEHCYFKSEIDWVEDISTQKVGDMNITTSESGNFIVGTIVNLHKGITDAKVKEDVKYQLEQEKGYEEVNKDYQEFLKKSTATILGEDYPLYQEETAGAEEIPVP